jgi:trans-aconitate methyltransferase
MPRNSTRSLYDTDVVYIDIHGRRYCGDYYMPNDEDEQDRLQILHELYLYILSGKLTTVSLSNPRKILDIGTGTGEWAMAMGDEYPQAEVVGTDIAKIQPSAVPLNVFFEIDDAEEEGGWTWAEDEFDLVHFRSMVGAFTDWKHIYTEAYKHLTPGGWIEVVDFDDHKDLLSYFGDNGDLKSWHAAVSEATKKTGRPRSVDHMKVEALSSLGFVDVTTKSYDLPMGSWPEGREEQKFAKHFLIAQLWGIEAVCLRPLTEQLGWDPEELKKFCDRVTAEVKGVALDPEKGKGLGFKLSVLVGRKPGAPEIGRAGASLRPADYDDDGESVNTMTNANGPTVNGT